MTSTEALELEDIPGRLLVVGGGYIGMEMGMVYARLGSEIVLVEALNHLLSGVDADLVRPVAKVAESLFKEVRLKTKCCAWPPAAGRSRWPWRSAAPGARKPTTACW